MRRKEMSFDVDEKKKKKRKKSNETILLHQEIVTYFRFIGIASLNLQ